MSDQSRVPLRVLLVFPRFKPNSFWSLDQPCEVARAGATAPPLGFITLAAMLPQNWNFRLINHNFQDFSESDLDGVDIVMTGGMLPQEPDTIAIIRMCKAKGVPVAVGGPAVTSTPEIYAEADFMVIGEAESVIDDFVAALERGDRKGVFTAPKFQADVTQTPIPRFDLLNFRDYLWVNVQFSRGCPFTCEFCDIIELYGRAPRTKTTPQILAELQRLYELGYRGHVDFVDDNLIGNKKAVKLFLPHLVKWQEERGYPFRFSTEASLNLSDDTELLQLMRMANFFAVFVGIESPDEETLVHTSKKQNTRRSIAESVHRIYAAGIFVTAGFIIGFDTEKGSIARPMTNCITDTSIPISIVGMLTALPNTQLSRRLRKEGRLFDDFSHLQEFWDAAGDACTAGLNFRTLRPRREILEDFRDTVASVYHPDAYFSRVRQLGRMLDRPVLPAAKLHWGRLFLDIGTISRAAWRFTVRYPEIARPYWASIVDCLRHNPRAIESVLANLTLYLHHYAFSRFVVGQVDAMIAEIDAGRYVEPAPLAPLPATACGSTRKLAAVA